jgi:RimJ/RimL family protein N-acetyltransferase
MQLTMNCQHIIKHLVYTILIGLVSIYAHAGQDLLKPENHKCIQTQRLILRPFERSDFGWYQKLVSQPAVAEHLYNDGLPENLKTEAERNLERLNLAGHLLPLVFTVCLKSYYRLNWLNWLLGPKRIGVVGLYYTEGSAPNSWKLYVYHAFDPKFHRQGYGTEAGRMLASYGVQVVKNFPKVFEGLYAWVFTTNIASIKNLFKIGFKTISQTPSQPDSHGRVQQVMTFPI